jgi:hypothetical protein
MNRLRLGTTLVVITAWLLATAPALADTKKPPKKPKAPPKKSATSPKPKPKTQQPVPVHSAAPTQAHSTLHAVHHDFYAGKAPRSLSWYRHHHHRGWVYEVRYRSPRWQERSFASLPAARTFMVYLRHHHFQRRLFHPANALWMVSYRNPHSHHFGTYAALPVARRVEVNLRQSGMSAWLRWHRRYF